MKVKMYTSCFIGLMTLCLVVSEGRPNSDSPIKLAAHSVSEVRNICLTTVSGDTVKTAKRKSAKPNQGKQTNKDDHQKFNRSWREEYYAGAPMKIGNSVQYLFDDYIVEDRYGLKRTVGPVEKYEGNPLSLGPVKPWEISKEWWSGAYLIHVLHDPYDKLFKGWYLAYRNQPGVETGYNYSTLYAESKDGILWEKPELDFYKINGSGTNYVLHKEQGTALMQDVMLDTTATDPGRRFTALVKIVPPGETERCIVRMFSADGKKWILPSDPILFRGANDGSYSLVSDQGRWLIYRRPATNAMVGKGEGIYGASIPLSGSKSGINNKRRLALTTSTDLKNWTYPRGIDILDEVDDSEVQILGNQMDIDWATVTKQGDMFFGFLHLMDNLTMTNPRQNHLMWSRDGLDWHRLPLRPDFIQNGAVGEWDGGSIGSISIVPAEDRYLIYYTGSNISQGETRLPRSTANGLAYLGRDRFIGMQAGPDGGYMLTRQFVFEGNRLELNFSSQVKAPPTNWGSIIKAEILVAPSDQLPAIPIPGFTMADCDPITIKDSFKKTVTWKGISDLSALKKMKIYIRFYAQNSTLYTFRVAD